MELVISFDDTGSMSSVRAQVRQKIEGLVKHLLSLDPQTRIGIIIHNDYCDRDIIKHLDLTNSESEIIKFINSKLDGYGGDADECYELALNYMHSKFSWKEEKRLGIIIGDCNPHGVGYQYGSFINKMDWKVELQTCIENGIKVYPIQALGNYSSKAFYNKIAEVSGVNKLDLSQFAHITQYITAISYHENDKLDDYENSNEEFKTNHMFKKMFAKLRGLAIEEIEEEYTPSYRSSHTSTPPKDYGSGDGTATIDLSSKFQVLEVGSSPRVIREFVEDNGAAFKTGRGFYQFVLTETIQEKKEILFVDKKTGEVKSDTVWCRTQLGVPFGTRGRVNPRTTDCCKQYDVFIQSTSYNRKLDPNTKFLYELDYK